MGFEGAHHVERLRAEFQRVNDSTMETVAINPDSADFQALLPLMVLGIDLQLYEWRTEPQSGFYPTGDYWSEHPLIAGPPEGVD